MAILYTVSDGDTAVAADLNQLVSAFVNQFGITDNTQSALGRLVLPQVVPGSPVTGQTWLDTTEGEGGRLYIQHSNDPVPHNPFRQVKIADFNSYGTTGSGFADVTGASLSITTTGGFLLIGVMCAQAAGPAYLQARSNENTASNDTYPRAELRAVVGATNLEAVYCYGELQLSTNEILAMEMSMPIGFHWLYGPAPGAYTVKLQIRHQGIFGNNWVAEIGSGRLVVMEIGERLDL